MPNATIALSDRFQLLDQRLVQLRPYWQLRPFGLRELPWHHNAALRAWLDGLSDAECVALEADDQRRAGALSAFIPAADELYRLAQLPAPAPLGGEEPTARLSYHIPGRKWAQIRAFDQALTPAGDRFVEWCAGKGHLGRLLAYRHQRPVTSLEWQASLCHAGQLLTDKLGLPCRMEITDVMSDAPLPLLRPDQHAVALHACGRLHVRLLQLASSAGLKGISISPCCYALIDEETYPALSGRAAQSPLRLSRHDLKLCLQDTVTAGSRERRLRERELGWRLGFDLLQRQLRSVDEYLPCPVLPKGLLSGDFTAYCHAMADRKALSLPTGIDFSAWEQAGRQRIGQITRMELVRNLFRRPLEIWLALDRALFLQEQGYAVQLRQFCDYRLTPRNLLIEGIKPA